MVTCEMILVVELQEVGNSALDKYQVNRLNGNERKRGIQDTFKLVHLRRWKRGVANS